MVCSLTGLKEHAKSAFFLSINLSHIVTAIRLLMLSKNAHVCFLQFPFSNILQHSRVSAPFTTPPLGAGRGAGSRAAGVPRPAGIRAAAQPGDLVRCLIAPCKSNFHAPDAQ